MVGFLDAIKNIITGRSMVGRGAHSMFGGVAGGIAGGFGNMLGDKIFGIPTPKTGDQLGSEAFAYDQARFPKTNPWERLGSSNPMGGVEQSRIGQVTQREQFKNTNFQLGAERSNKRKIAQLQANTQIRGAQISRGLGPDGDQPDAKFSAELENLDAQTLLNLQKKATELKNTGVRNLELKFFELLKVYGGALAALGTSLGIGKAFSLLMRKKAKVRGIPTPGKTRSRLPKTGALSRTHQNIPKKGSNKGHGDRDIRKYNSRYRGKDSGPDYKRPDTKTMSGREYWKAVRKSKSTR